MRKELHNRPDQDARLSETGEEAARRYLIDHGYGIIHCNWRAGRRGELDLIATDPSGLLVFAEVKTRLITGCQPGLDWPGFDAIHRQKQRQIISLARMYLAHCADPNTPCRFDVLVVWYLTGPEHTQLAQQHPQIFHIPDAFSA